MCDNSIVFNYITILIINHFSWSYRVYIHVSLLFEDFDLPAERESKHKSTFHYNYANQLTNHAVTL